MFDFWPGLSDKIGYILDNTNNINITSGKLRLDEDIT